MSGEPSDGDPIRRAAVIAPGGTSNAEIPLLTFTARAARQRRASLHQLHWGYDSESLRREFRPVPRGRVPVQVAERVVARTAAVLDGLDGAAPVIVGKSLGSAAAPVAAGHGVPAVWFTPLLADPAVTEELRRATAPFLLIGGTADSEWWDGRTARSLTTHVLEVEHADHGMFVPGSLRESAVILGEMIAVVERFLDDIVWPA